MSIVIFEEHRSIGQVGADNNQIRHQRNEELLQLSRLRKLRHNQSAARGKVDTAANDGLTMFRASVRARQQICHNLQLLLREEAEGRDDSGRGLPRGASGGRDGTEGRTVLLLVCADACHKQKPLALSLSRSYTKPLLGRPTVFNHRLVGNASGTKQMGNAKANKRLPNVVGALENRLQQSHLKRL